MYNNKGKQKSKGRDKQTMEVEEQIIDDRFGDVPA
jgi:hypothetical protein